MNQKISIEQVISEAFGLWKSAMRYNLMFSLLYFGLLMVFVNTILLHTGILDKIMAIYPIIYKNPEIFQKRMLALMATEEFANAGLMIIICKGLIYPLHIGLIKIYRKIESKEEVLAGDIFAGYSGVNFFKLASYYIAWVMIFNFAQQLLIVPAILWIMLTMLIPLLMYFKQEPMGTALLWNFRLMKDNFVLFLVCVLTAILFSYTGMVVFFVGYVLTFPFWNAIIYVLYKYLLEFEEKK